MAWSPRSRCGRHPERASRGPPRRTLFVQILPAGPFVSAMGLLRQPSLRTHVLQWAEMRIRAALILLLVALSSLCGCNRGRNAVVVLDDQWAIKRAQADCQSRQREGVPPCTVDPVVMITDLEAQTARAFGLNAACRGMTLVTLNASENPSQLNSRHTWWLFLELMRSNIPNELRYTVSPTEDPHRSRSATGQGKPDSIVREFCDYVQQGGTIE
jgi:hypothetical protein